VQFPDFYRHALLACWLSSQCLVRRTGNLNRMRKAIEA
jgi:hypothetical protein